MPALTHEISEFDKLKSNIQHILYLAEDIRHCSNSILRYTKVDLQKMKSLLGEEVTKNIIKPYSLIIFKESKLLEYAYDVIKTCQNIPLASNEEYANSFKKQLEYCKETCKEIQKTIRNQNSKLDILIHEIQPSGQAIVHLRTLQLWISKIDLNQDISLLKCVFDAFCDMEREIDIIHKEYIRLVSELLN